MNICNYQAVYVGKILTAHVNDTWIKELAIKTNRY